MTLLAFGLASCETPTASTKAPALRLADLPASVYAEAKRETPAPVTTAPTLTGKQAERLIVRLVQSDKRRKRALNAAIVNHEQQRAYLATRATQTAAASKKWSPWAE